MVFFFYYYFNTAQLQQLVFAGEKLKYMIFPKFEFLILTIK
jgi:hypothetical protein